MDVIRSTRVVVRPPEVHVYWLAEAHAARLSPDVLSADERARWERFRSASRRREFLAGRWLLRVALGAWALPIEALYIEPSGRPSLPATDLDVSVSHAGGHVLVAVARGGRVGVDVEMHEPRERSLMDSFFHADERAWAGTSVERLHRLWTLKEAALKALGTGVSGDPLRVHVSPADLRVRMRGVEDDRLWTWRRDGADHTAAAVLVCPRASHGRARFLLFRVAPEGLEGHATTLGDIA